MTTSTLKQSVSALLLVLLLVISCKKQETAEVKTGRKGKVSYFAKASGTAPKGTIAKTADSSASAVYVKWSSASIFVEKISFVARNNSLLDTTIIVGKNLNILNADVLTGVFNLPAGLYRDVKVKLFLKKANYPDLAFKLNGTFENKEGGTDSIMVASSLPFEANLEVNDITINSSDDYSDNYKVVFNFNLDKVLAGISASDLQAAANSNVRDGKRTYYIWKGGSQDVPFYNQVTTNWQSVASALISQE